MSRRFASLAASAFLFTGILGHGLTACAAGGPEGQTRIAVEAPGSALAAIVRPEAPLGRQPVTVTLRPPAALAQTLRRLDAAQDERPAVRLAIHAGEPPAAAAVGVRVFLNLPQADAGTPIEDRHYVGSFTFGQAGPYGGAGPDGARFLLDAGPVLRRLPPGERLPERGSLTVTLVAVPLRPDEGLPPDLAIPLRSVELSAHAGGETVD